MALYGMTWSLAGEPPLAFVPWQFGGFLALYETDSITSG